MIELAVILGFGALTIIVTSSLTFANAIDKRDRRSLEEERQRIELEDRERNMQTLVLPFPADRRRCCLCDHVGATHVLTASTRHVEWSCDECGGSYTTHPATRNP